VTAAVLGVVCLILLFQVLRQRRAPAEGGLAPGPQTARLWRQMFGEAPVYLVVSDAGLTTLEDMVGFQLSLDEYRKADLEALAEQRVADKAARAWIRQLLGHEFTTIADSQLARRVAEVDAGQGRRTEVVSARHADAARLQAGNVILAGPRRANPWLEPVELRLNFRSGFEEGERRRRAFVENVAPQSGEPAAYDVVWRHVGYCRVAYLPAAPGTSLLIVSGSDLSSSDAGADMITTESSVTALMARLGVGPVGRIPHFEVLVRVEQRPGLEPKFEIVAHRVVAVSS